DRGVPGPGVRDGAGARAAVAGRRGDEDAGVERVEEGTVDEVAPRVLPAADREVQHVHTVGHGLFHGGATAGGGTAGIADQVGDGVGPRGPALHGAGEGLAAHLHGRFVQVAGDRAGGVAAVVVGIAGIRGCRVRVVGADELVVADVLVV